MFGAEAVHESPLIMAGEDFSYYLNHRPGCFMFVGAGNIEAGIVHPHHHPKFDIDEKIHAERGKFVIRNGFGLYGMNAVLLWRMLIVAVMLNIPRRDYGHGR